LAGAIAEIATRYGLSRGHALVELRERDTDEAVGELAPRREQLRDLGAVLGVALERGDEEP